MNKEILLKAMMELDVQFITTEGFYTNDDGEEELQEHTKETWELFILGLSRMGKAGGEDYFEGVLIENDTFVGQYYIEQETVYRNIL